MKESTKLILMYVGAGVAANMLLAGTVAGATSGYPMVAAGAEGLAALGGAAGAWKFKGKKRVAAAIIGGAGAGLLVNSIQSGALSPAPAKPAGGATPQAAPKLAPGSTLPAASIPVAGKVISEKPGWTEVSGQVPPGSSVPTPNRPPTVQEYAAYNDWLRQEEETRRIAEAQAAAALQQGSIPTVSTEEGDSGGIMGWFDQSGAAFRVSPQRQQSGFGGRAASFRR